MAATLIERRDLLAQAVGLSLVALEAPGGFGKSTFIGQLATALDRPTVRVELRAQTDASALIAALRAAAVRAGLSAAAAAFDADDPSGSVARLPAAGKLFVVVDEAQHTTTAAAEWLIDVADSPTDVVMCIAGRRLPQAVRKRATRDAGLFTADELRLDAASVGAILGGANAPDDDATVAEVLRATDGWPAAVALAAQVLAADETRLGGAPDGALRSLVRKLIEPISESDVATLRTLASLPLLTPEVATAVAGDGAYDALVDSGLPLRSRPDGWSEFPDAIREALEPLPLTTAGAAAAARIYAAEGELLEAVRLVWAAGDSAGVCALLAGEPRERLRRAGLALLEPIIESIPDAVLHAHPNALVQLVRAAERHDRLRDAWLERGAMLRTPETAAGRALTVEWALAVARAGALSEARQAVDEAMARAGTDEAVAIARAHLVRAYTLIVGDTAGATDAALVDLEQAAARFKLAGDHAWEADALQAAGFGCHYTNGRYEAAIESLERSLALRPAADAGRSQALTYLAEVMLGVGRVDEAAVALREARAIAQRLGDKRSIAYVAWSTANLYAQRRDRQHALAELQEAEAHSSDVARSLAGIDFLTDAARIRMVVGDEAGARRDLERAEAVAAGTEREDLPLAARARFEILFGDARTAIAALDRLDRSSVTYRGEQWLRELLRGAALMRLGERDQARDLIVRMRAELGDDADRPALLEPELLALATAASEASDETAARITLLGGFGVARGARNVTPAAGRPATLVKLIALRGTIGVEEALELLWPDDEGEIDRARIRNVLHRVRSTSGELIERVGDALTLAPDVIVDAQRFEQAAAAALNAPREERAALARRALAWSTGELLPADRYADWADVPRERVRRRRLALLDLVADDAIAHGELDEAARVLDEAITDDPLEEMRYDRLARALLTQGRSRAALGVAQRGIAAAEELGVDPSAELVATVAAIAAVEGRTQAG